MSNKNSLPEAEAVVKKPRKENRFRNWTTVFYPDSQADDLEAKLAELHVAGFLSPLHDKDVDGDGKIKKAHRHCVLMFSSVKSRAQVEEIVKPLGAVGLESVDDIRYMSRYLCHLDSPNKQQYDTGNVYAFGGADYAEKIGLTSDKYKAIREMIAYIEAEDVNSYRALVSYAANERDDWFRALCDSSTMVVDKYIKSRFWEKYQMQNEIDENLRKSGGEVRE